MQSRKINIELYDCQVDIILNALEVYCYDVNEKYKNRKLSKTKAENSEKCLIKDTYHELCAFKNENQNQTNKFERIS